MTQYFQLIIHITFKRMCNVLEIKNLKALNITVNLYSLCQVLPVFTTFLPSVILITLLLLYVQTRAAVTTPITGKMCTKSIRLFRQSSSCAWQAPRQSFGPNPSLFQKPQRLFLHYFRRSTPGDCILRRWISQSENKGREGREEGREKRRR